MQINTGLREKNPGKPPSNLSLTPPPLLLQKSRGQALAILNALTMRKVECLFPRLLIWGHTGQPRGHSSSSPCRCTHLSSRHTSSLQVHNPPGHSHVESGQIPKKQTQPPVALFSIKPSHCFSEANKSRTFMVARLVALYHNPPGHSPVKSGKVRSVFRISFLSLLMTSYFQIFWF